MILSLFAFAAEVAEALSWVSAHGVQPSDSLPPVWLVTPFLVLLLMIAAGPLLYHRL